MLSILFACSSLALHCIYLTRRQLGSDARKGPFLPVLQAEEGEGGGGGEKRRAVDSLDSCGQYGHRSRSGGEAGRVIGDESEGGVGLQGCFQPATEPNLENLEMFHQTDSSIANSIWGESGLQLVRRPAFADIFKAKLNVGCRPAFLNSDKHILQFRQIHFSN